MTQIDDELRARFAELREVDEGGGGVPSFRSMWNDAERYAPRSRGGLVWAAAAAAGVVLAAGLVLGRTRSRETETVVPSILTWTSPTASLLHMSNVAILTPPSLLSSVLDGVTAPANGRYERGKSE
jgi:hypothetical protein